MRVYGLTGGIASGKSLVTEMLRELGAVVVDSDAIAREVVASGTEGLREIVEVFGPSTQLPDGTLDRGALAERIFADPSARLRLNAILHPRIGRRIEEEVESIRARGRDCIVVVDIPLLLDTIGPEAFSLDGVVVVSADEAAQLARLMARDGLTESEAGERLRAQRPLREKAAQADWVIENSGSRGLARAQVEALWKAWQADLRPETLGRWDEGANPGT